MMFPGALWSFPNFPVFFQRPVPITFWASALRESPQRSLWGPPFKLLVCIRVFPLCELVDSHPHPQVLGIDSAISLKQRPCLSLILQMNESQGVFETWAGMGSLGNLDMKQLGGGPYLSLSHLHFLFRVSWVGTCL